MNTNNGNLNIILGLSILIFTQLYHLKTTKNRKKFKKFTKFVIFYELCIIPLYFYFYLSDIDFTNSGKFNFLVFSFLPSIQFMIWWWGVLLGFEDDEEVDTEKK